MDAADIRAFAQRDWAAVSELKAEHWARAKRRLSPEEALRIADGLRAHLLTMRPDWPSEEDRQADLAIHTRVAESLRRVKATRD